MLQTSVDVVAGGPLVARAAGQVYELRRSQPRPTIIPGGSPVSLFLKLTDFLASRPASQVVLLAADSIPWEILDCVRTALGPRNPMVFELVPKKVLCQRMYPSSLGSGSGLPDVTLNDRLSKSYFSYIHHSLKKENGVLLEVLLGAALVYFTAIGVASRVEPLLGTRLTDTGDVMTKLNHWYDASAQAGSS